jgi:hypothetical protein
MKSDISFQINNDGLKNIENFYPRQKKTHGIHLGGIFAKKVTESDLDKSKNSNIDRIDLLKKSKYQHKWMVKSDSKVDLNGNISIEYGSNISEFIANGLLGIILGDKLVPKIRLIKDVKNKQLLLGSRFFDNCNDLQQLFTSNGMSLSNRIIHLKNQHINHIPNFHLILAASLLVGDPDFHPSNIVVIHENNDNYYFAKIDHGKAFSGLSVQKMIDQSFKKFNYDMDIIKSPEFTKALEQILKIDRKLLYEQLAKDIIIVEKYYGKIENTDFATKKIKNSKNINKALQKHLDLRFKELKNLHKELSKKLEIPDIKKEKRKSIADIVINLFSFKMVSEGENLDNFIEEGELVKSLVNNEEKKQEKIKSFKKLNKRLSTPIGEYNSIFLEEILSGNDLKKDIKTKISLS